MRKICLLAFTILMICISCQSSKGSKQEDRLEDFQIKSIVFFGENCTYGSSLSDRTKAFPHLIQERIDSLRWPYYVENAAAEGERSDQGLERIPTVIHSKMEVIVLTHGPSDPESGLSLDETRENLQGMIDIARTQYPMSSIVLADLYPLNLDDKTRQQVDTLFLELAINNQAAYIPSPWRDMSSQLYRNVDWEDFLQEDTHKFIANHIWQHLENFL